MALTGKYNFEGLKKLGAAALSSALAGTPLVKFPSISNFIFEMFTNWLANKGLIVMNVGAYYVNGKLDVKGLTDAMVRGYEAVETGRELTPEEIKKIDDDVIAAARKALPYGRKATSPKTPTNPDYPYGPG